MSYVITVSHAPYAMCRSSYSTWHMTYGMSYESSYVMSCPSPCLMSPIIAPCHVSCTWFHTSCCNCIIARTPANQPTSQPANQPTSQPANQPTSQPARPPTRPLAHLPAQRTFACVVVFLHMLCRLSYFTCFVVASIVVPLFLSQLLRLYVAVAQCARAAGAVGVG